MRLKLCDECPMWPVLEEIKSSVNSETYASFEVSRMMRVINSAHKGVTKKPDIDSQNLRMYISPSGYKDLPYGIGSLCASSVLDSVADCFTMPCEGKITP